MISMQFFCLFFLSQELQGAVSPPLLFLSFFILANRFVDLLLLLPSELSPTLSFDIVKLRRSLTIFACKPPY